MRNPLGHSAFAAADLEDALRIRSPRLHESCKVVKVNKHFAISLGHPMFIRAEHASGKRTQGQGAFLSLETGLRDCVHLCSPEPQDAEEEAAEGDLDSEGQSEDGGHYDS